MNLSWLLLPFLIIFTLVISIYNQSMLLLFFSVFSYMFMQCCIYLSTFAVIEKLEKKQIKHKFTLLCAGCISTLISNIGPIYSLINIKMKKYKTER